MKIIFYLLIVVIITYCLIINLYRNKKETFYENIEFCVFCVFNWSRTANNPPPVAYVDINFFKSSDEEITVKILNQDLQFNKEGIILGRDINYNYRLNTMDNDVIKGMNYIGQTTKTTNDIKNSLVKKFTTLLNKQDKIINTI